MSALIDARTTGLRRRMLRRAEDLRRLIVRLPLEAADAVDLLADVEEIVGDIRLQSLVRHDAAGDAEAAMERLVGRLSAMVDPGYIRGMRADLCRLERSGHSLAATRLREALDAHDRRQTGGE